MSITMTEKEVQQMITLITKDTKISKDVVIGFLNSKLQPRQPMSTMVRKPDFCNSDLK